MIIDSKLLEYAQAVESDYVKDYYLELNEIENQLKSWRSTDSLNKFPMTKRAMEKRLDSARTMEPEIKRYKYFYKVADYSLYYFKLKCGEYSSDSDFLVIGAETPSRKKFKEITEKFNLDYLVRYTQISAKGKGNEYEMKLTATLYSRNSEILFKEEFSSPGKCPDDKLRCVTPFCCMLNNIMKSSTTKICEMLEAWQRK
jgi:hypothetical protein